MERGAEPLVLVPGLVSDARIFAPQIVALSAFRAIHVAHVIEDATIEAMARSVLADAPPRFALAGHAMGGVVALEVARVAPERVTRIALLCSDCLAEHPVVAAAREELIVAARAGRLDEAVLQVLPEEAFAPGPGRNRLRKALMTMACDLGADVFVRQTRAMQKRADRQKTLRALRVPSLILGGKHDTLAPPRRQEVMSTMCWPTRLEIVEDAGHMPMLEAPEEVTAALYAWLDRQAPLTLRPDAPQESDVA